MSKPKAPSDERAVSRTGWLGERFFSTCFSPSVKNQIDFCHLPHQREALRCGGTWHSESFWNHRQCRWFSLTKRERGPIKDLSLFSLKGTDLNPYNIVFVVCPTQLSYQILSGNVKDVLVTFTRFSILHQFILFSLYNIPSCNFHTPMLSYSQERVIPMYR